MVSVFKIIFKLCVPGIGGKENPLWAWTLADRESAGRSLSQIRSRKVGIRKEQIDTFLHSVVSCWGPSPLFLHYQRFLSAVMPSNPPPLSRWVMKRKIKKKCWVGALFYRLWKVKLYKVINIQQNLRRCMLVWPQLPHNHNDWNRL